MGKLNIVSDGENHSILVVKAYQKHTLSKDEPIATLTNTIGEVLRKLKDGGTNRTC